MASENHAEHPRLPQLTVPHVTRMCAGLLYEDVLVETPDVQLALKRLPKDVMDARELRLKRAMVLSSQQKRLVRCAAPPPRYSWRRSQEHALSHSRCPLLPPCTPATPNPVTAEAACAAPPSPLPLPPPPPPPRPHTITPAVASTSSSPPPSPSPPPVPAPRFPLRPALEADG